MDTGCEVRSALAKGEEMWALKMTLQGRDDLRAVLAQGRSAADAWECDPGLVGELG